MPANVRKNKKRNVPNKDVPSPAKKSKLGKSGSLVEDETDVVPSPAKKSKLGKSVSLIEDETDVPSLVKKSKLGKSGALVEDAAIKPVLVVLPGASGKLSNSMKDVMMEELMKHFEVRIRNGKYKGWNPAGDENMNSVLELCPTQGSWYILGNSFGNRIICALCTGQKFQTPPKKVIFCGYPMYGPKRTDERVELIQALPADLDLLCISGSRDDFISGVGSSSSRAVFENVIAGMNNKNMTQLRLLEGGKHGVIDVSKKQLDDAITTVLEWILSFVNQ